MKNRYSLSLWIFVSIFMVFATSCQKDNYDISTTTSEEFEPEANYTGDDNIFSFGLTEVIPNSSTTTGGSSAMNEITKEVLSNGDIKWKLFSTLTDGFTVTNEIIFITPNTDAGIYVIEELHFLVEDPDGTIVDEYNWTSVDMQNATINVSGLTDSPGIVSGNTGDVVVVDTPGALEYFYGASFSEVPIN